MEIRKAASDSHNNDDSINLDNYFADQLSMIQIGRPIALAPKTITDVKNQLNTSRTQQKLSSKLDLKTKPEHLVDIYLASSREQNNLPKLTQIQTKEKRINLRNHNYQQLNTVPTPSKDS